MAQGWKISMNSSQNIQLYEESIFLFPIRRLTGSPWLMRAPLDVIKTKQKILYWKTDTYVLYWFHEDNFKIIKNYSTLILLVLLHFWSFLPMAHSFWPIFLNLPSLQLHRQKFDRNDIAKYFAPQSLKVYHCGKFSMAIKIQPQKKNMALVMGVWLS